MERIPCPNPGVYPGVDFELYKQWDAINPSSVKVLIEESLLAYRRYMKCGIEQSKSMEMGSLVHTAIFEPDQMPIRYALWSGGVRRGNEYKAWCAANADREQVREVDYQDALMIRDAAHNHPCCGPLLRSPGKREVAVVWRDPGTGQMCKGRIDLLTDGGRLVDVKTAKNHLPHSFFRESANRNYHVSVAAYRLGLQANGVTVNEVDLIAVKNNGAYDAVQYPVPPHVLREGEKLWHQSLQRIAHAKKTGEWPGYSDEPIELELPEWATSEPEITFEGE
jgi:exodeoxyribonuclease VIII